MRIKKNWLILISTIWTGVFLSLYFCVGFCFPYEEQSHIFIFSKSYFQSAVDHPGGLVFWLSEFLIQFYYYPVAGALVLSTVYLLLTSLTLALGHEFACRFSKGKIMTFPLWAAGMALLPNIVLICVCRFSLMVPLGILLSLSLVFCLKFIRNPLVGLVAALLLLPGCYYYIGCPGFYLLPGAFPLLAIRREKQIGESRVSWALCGVAAIIALSLPFAASRFWMFPVKTLYLGINDFTFNGSVPRGYYVAVILYVLIPCSIGLAARIRRNAAMSVIVWAAIAITGYCLIPKSFRISVNDMVEYDFLVRHSRWDDIIEKSEKSPSRHPMAMISTNLALANKGLLDSELLNYPQNSYKGLLEDTGRNGVSSFPSIEAYRLMGLNEVAFRGAFEYQESLPSYRRSGRCLKMLSQTAASGGNRRLAEKYDRLCRQTLYYKDELSESCVKSLSDGMFYFDELPEWMMEICREHPENKIVCQYLVAWLLLTCDMERFGKMMPLIASFYEGSSTPRIVQEAAAYIALKDNLDYDSIPVDVDADVAANLNQFISSVRSGMPPEALRHRFPSSYWTYLVINQ